MAPIVSFTTYSVPSAGPVLSILGFFFQAEDGIRAKLVTGGQTCALPISKLPTTDGAQQCHRLGVAIHHRLGFVERPLLAPAHDRQLTVFGTRLAA